MTRYRLDMEHLFLMHSVIGGKVLETWDVIEEGSRLRPGVPRS